MKLVDPTHMSMEYGPSVLKEKTIHDQDSPKLKMNISHYMEFSMYVNLILRALVG